MTENVINFNPYAHLLQQNVQISKMLQFKVCIICFVFDISVIFCQV